MGPKRKNQGTGLSVLKRIVTIILTVLPMLQPSRITGCAKLYVEFAALAHGHEVCAMTGRLNRVAVLTCVKRSKSSKTLITVVLLQILTGPPTAPQGMVNLDAP